MTFGLRSVHRSHVQSANFDDHGFSGGALIIVHS